MKLLINIVIVFSSVFSYAQKERTISSQKDRLRQYAGQWISSINPDSDGILAFPEIKMSSLSNFNNNSLTVEVFKKNDNNQYKPLLHELIGYDTITDMIFASGHDSQGAFFTGRGRFLSEKKWIMQDRNLNDFPTMQVHFNFQNYTDVILEGYDNNEKSLWKTRYIKQNPKDKKIGVQLVSVHDEMLKNPQATLVQLGRMGYSYVETFVYSDEGFYGYSPEEFKAMVEKADMQFLGSMTFFDAFDKTDKDVSNWWYKTIKDHKIAGVEYLSTSINNIKSIKTLKELKQYSDYYNKVGKWCKENGLQFIFHNHKDEFLLIEGVRAYDYLLQNTNPEYVFFQSDLYWMDVAGINPIDYFEKYPNRFISWHVKDYKELGKSGKIDFKNIFKHAEVAGLKYTVAEVEEYNFPPLFSVGLAWEYIYYELLK